MLAGNGAGGGFAFATLWRSATPAADAGRVRGAVAVGRHDTVGLVDAPEPENDAVMSWELLFVSARQYLKGANPADLYASPMFGNFRDFPPIMVHAGTNSGVFIRCASRTEISAATCYEVNIYDTRPDPTYGTGAIVNLAAVSPMPKAGGRWNTMVITARDDMFSVVAERPDDRRRGPDAARREGPFALQRAAGTVRFRKVEIRPL